MGVERVNLDMEIYRVSTVFFFFVLGWVFITNSVTLRYFLVFFDGLVGILVSGDFVVGLV